MARRRKKRPRRLSKRPLSRGDIQILNFLWTWKAASHRMLALVGYPRKSAWWVYKALRQLEREKYIERLPRGKFLFQENWTLTELGFEAVLMDRDDIVEQRFRVHAPAHDFFATCLQLGDFWLGRGDQQFFSEQMLGSLSSEHFPNGMKRGDGHVPDGMTILGEGGRKRTIGYEVDLNLKDKNRYYETIYYHRFWAKTDVLVWLVRNEWILGRIRAGIEETLRTEAGFLAVTAFVLLDDFKRDAWGAKISSGYMAGETLRKLHANELEKAGKNYAALGQFGMREIFFPVYQSPQKQRLIETEIKNEKR